ncbi:MAG: VanZ family protein [Turicibacter sp.]|jgi:glycopeptide antibiotics resistance protein
MFFTYGYLFYIPITILTTLPFIINGLIKKRPLPYYILVLLAIIYINKAIDIAFFPIAILNIEEFNIYNNINLKINLINSNYYHLLLNMLLTLPIGVGIQYILNTKFLTRLIISIILSASFELIQLLILFTLKPIDLFVDINDLICNISGALIGLVIAHIINKLQTKCPINTNYQDLFSYIHQVGINCINNQKSLHNIHKKNSFK